MHQVTKLALRVGYLAEVAVYIADLGVEVVNLALARALDAAVALARIYDLLQLRAQVLDMLLGRFDAVHKLAHLRLKPDILHLAGVHALRDVLHQAVLRHLHLLELALVLLVQLLKPLLPRQVLLQLAAQFVQLLLDAVELHFVTSAIVFVLAGLQHVHHGSLRQL